MSEIYINIKEIRNINHSVSVMSSNLSIEKKKLGMMRWTIPEEIMTKCEIRERFNEVIRRIEKVETELEEIHRVTANSISQYMRTEEKLQNSADKISEWI
ncbi:MAG: hypothetical protein J6M24_06000 [Lachnospiraceae bacterium]|nr:hypothetical protein [Lachnospiraceae bacterium]